MARTRADAVVGINVPVLESIFGRIRELIRSERGIAVPTALNTGSNSGPSFCLLFGTHVPFDAATLDALYAGHGSYASQVAQVVNGNLAAGYITQQAAQVTRADAARSGIGQ